MSEKSKKILFTTLYITLLLVFAVIGFLLAILECLSLTNYC